jgi:hypothetical protein
MVDPLRGSRPHTYWRTVRLRHNLVAYPGMKLLLRASQRPEAAPLELGLDGFNTRFPGIAACTHRVEQLPGYEKTSLSCLPWEGASPDSRLCASGIEFTVRSGLICRGGDTSQKRSWPS